MKYTITTQQVEEVALSVSDDSVVLELDDNNYRVLTFEQFKEFRRAVGYVWQELEGGDK